MITYKILIVDDMIENISVISSALESSENNVYNLYQSGDAETAFIIAKKRQPDLIITDWDMPGTNGIELIKKLKSHKNTKAIPVIMATGIMLSPNDLKIALEAGAIDFVRKPVDIIELLARVRSVLELDFYKKKLIEKKNKELAENTLMLVRNNSFNKKIKYFLQQIYLSNAEDKQLAENLIKEINGKIHDDSWLNFELTLDSTHVNFKQVLLSKFPKITPAELKICILLRLEMSNKEIADAIYHTPQSVRVTRTRIRKKLNLPAGANLISFLVKL